VRASSAGLCLVAELTERLGLTDALSAAMAPTRRRHSGDDPGEVLVGIVLTLTDDGKPLSDLVFVRSHPGPVRVGGV
jgi:hypothetical protein